MDNHNKRNRRKTKTSTIKTLLESFSDLPWNLQKGLRPTKPVCCLKHTVKPSVWKCWKLSNTTGNSASCFIVIYVVVSKTYKWQERKIKCATPRSSGNEKQVHSIYTVWNSSRVFNTQLQAPGEQDVCWALRNFSWICIQQDENMGWKEIFLDHGALVYIDTSNLIRTRFYNIELHFSKLRWWKTFEIFTILIFKLDYKERVSKNLLMWFKYSSSLVHHIKYFMLHLQSMCLHHKTK